MAALTTTSFDKALKVYYTAQRVKLQAYQKNPLLALLPKMEDFKGKNMPLAIWYRTGQGVSATFSTAQTNAGVGGYENFILTRVKGYGIGKLENEVMEASRGDKAAFLEATVEIDGIMHQVTRDLAIALYRKKDGVRGQNSATTAYNTTTNVLTLKNREDVTNFEVGMKIVFADASDLDSGTITLRAHPSSGNAFQILSIDRSAGTFVIDADPTSIAADDYIAREGDLTASSKALKIAGLQEWLPTTVASSGDDHFGVDRYKDRDRLAGLYVDGSSMSVEDALIEGGARLHEVGATPDLCIMGPMKFARLVRELGSKVVHDIVKSPDMAKVGFSSVKVWTPAGVMDVVSDHNCPHDTAWMLTKSTWKLCTIGGAPRVITYGPGDGLRWLRVSDADEVEFRIGWYGNLGCHAPGHNARILLPS